MTLILLAAAAPILVWVPLPTGAIPATQIDAEDVALPLDLRSVFHADDAYSITYTVETYENFSEDAAAFKWGIDTNSDEGFDLFVFAEWDRTQLVAGVEDAAGNPVAAARVSRPSPNAITVSFPASVLGGVVSYRYGVIAENDLNGNGETDAGEQDVAPNRGLYGHKLVSAAAAPGLAGGPATNPDLPRVTEPPAPSSRREAAAAAPAIQSAAPRSSAAAETPPSSPSAAPSVEPPGALARTGGGALLALLAGVAFMAGGFMSIAESFMPQVKPRS